MPVLLTISSQLWQSDVHWKNARILPSCKLNAVSPIGNDSRKSFWPLSTIIRFVFFSCQSIGGTQLFVWLSSKWGLKYRAYRDARLAFKWHHPLPVRFGVQIHQAVPVCVCPSSVSLLYLLWPYDLLSLRLKHGWYLAVCICSRFWSRPS